MSASSRSASVFIALACLLGFAGCPPAEDDWYQSGSWLTVDAANRRAFVVPRRGGSTQEEARSELLAVSLDDGATASLLDVSGWVQMAWTPDFLVASTIEGAVVFDRASLAERTTFAAVSVVETNAQANLAITEGDEILLLDTDRLLEPLSRPTRTSMTFFRGGRELAVLTCVNDRDPVVRVRTFAVVELEAASDSSELAPTLDFTLHAELPPVTFSGGEPFCTREIHASPSGRYLATGLRGSHAMVIDLETQTGRAAEFDHEREWRLSDPVAFGFSPDERNVVVYGILGGLQRIELPSLAVVDTAPEGIEGDVWDELVVARTSCRDLIVFDTTVPDLAPIVDPRPFCPEAKGDVLLDFEANRAVDLRTGDPGPLPAVDASIARYVPEFDRIVGLQDEPQAVVVVDPGNGAAEMFELPEPEP